MKLNHDSALRRGGERVWHALRQPLIATVFGLVVGAIVILVCGQNPITVYAEMFDKSFLKPYYLFSTLTRATPIIICAMATGMAWRAGYINIGVEGQMVTGTFVATVCALYIPGPPVLVALLSWIIGMAAGALYALLPAVLTWKFNVSMVITTLMLNYVANYISSYFVTYPLKDTSGRRPGPSNPGAQRHDAPAPAVLHLHLQRRIPHRRGGRGLYGVHHQKNRFWLRVQNGRL